MNASTDLIYSTLDRKTDGFGSNKFRSEIEKLSLNELNLYIDKLHIGEWRNSDHRDEKLRLCLRVRNAHLLKLPWFYTARKHEYHTTYTSDLLRYDVMFIFIHFKSLGDFSSFKTEIKSLNLKDTTVVFLLHEQSSGKTELEKCATRYAKQGPYKGTFNFLVVKEEQYHHLVSRNQIQDILNYTFFGNFVSHPCIDNYDLKFTVKQGNVFFANRYPENAEIPITDFTRCLQVLLKKMQLTDRKDFTALLLIEVQPSFYGDALKIDDIVWMRTEMEMPHKNKLFLIKTNHEMQCPLRLSMLVSMNEKAP
jgi:hypothetical protein